MIDTIIDQAVKNQASALESIVRDAFRQHFGFPLDEVKDTENLECAVVMAYDLRAYRYCGHTFLLIDERAETEFKQDGTGEFRAVTRHRYLPV